MNRISFDPLNYQEGLFYNSQVCRDRAKAARDAEYKRLKAEGKDVKRSVLTGQLRKWESLGVPDGRTRDIFEITIY